MNKENRKAAIALAYNEAINHAPVVKATGKGTIAENILQRAKENNIPIYEDAALAELLSKMNVKETIPEELFLAVAEVFAFIYKIDRQSKNE
ncbi:EscU/YscU/HrcU family type III secretion system export apparatus switch protein [Caldibacillus lycopersici]|uniref:EscU/YscU/HrcU family type III secretion system export apparatus switch protein n=1 Tax=Perspicuibacillus lycopersici TaxID=1325689 RepID=A0AAE3ISW1_9BACI|nr:EscU/YscU/HrcU family type III secretion system export apparatus switch protein [Perspicuibacillus lycopersici]MCU9612119.1 EscU/YscU/HrcU family type III secretion system export apparatus switch protein [Perspicuibacillus lycopersici]